MLDQLAASATADDAVRRMLLARIDDSFRLATFILRDPVAAEDAVQEAALLAWRRRRTLRDSQAVDGWFTRILVNVCRDELRHRSRQPRVVSLGPPIDPGDESPGTLGGAGQTGERADLGPAIRRLNPDEQALLALRFGRELTVPEIADRLQVPEGTVKSRLHSTLQHLRAALEAERRFEEATR
jgi:RNA polymerase sigma-70 factor, ECF subfamily